MKGKKKSLLTSLLAIVLCLSLITGSTFALFTSTDKVDITVKSGKVKISATVDDLKLYSATIEETEDVAGTIETGNHAATYYYEGVDEIGVDEKGYFTNTGTAEYHTTGEKKGTLELDRVTPGDKVTFKVGLTNSSNVNIKYRVVVTVTSGLKLFRALKVKIDGSNLTGVSRTGNWTSLEANGTINDIPVEIYMPIDLDGEEYMDISTAMNITVEAVQGNAKTTDEILTTEVAAVAEEQVQTNENKETTAATVITDTDNLVTVTIPEGTKLTAAADPADDLSLAVKVKPQDTSSAALEDIANITVLSNKESASYDVSVLLVVNGEIDDNAEHAVDNDNDEVITVTMFVGTGLTGVELYHTHEGNTTQFTSVANANDVDTDKFYYNSETGYVTFKTTNFSEYTVVYNADFAYEKVDEVTGESEIVVLAATETAGVYVSTDEEGNESYVTVAEDENGNVTESVGNACIIDSDGVITMYETLKSAITAAISGDTVKLLKDDSITSNTEVSKNIVIDLNGNTMTQTRGITSSAELVIKNGKINESSYFTVSNGEENNVHSLSFKNVELTRNQINQNLQLVQLYGKKYISIDFENCSLSFDGTDNAPIVGFTGGTYEDCSVNFSGNEIDWSYYWVTFASKSGTECYVTFDDVNEDKISYDIFEYKVHKEITDNSTKFYSESLPKWEDQVSEQPDEFVIDEFGNVSIGSKEALAYLSKTASTNSYAGKTITLTADLDMSGYLWTPIKCAGYGHFEGTFDGNNHTISNIIAKNSQYGTGLFFSVIGTVRNLTMKNAHIGKTTNGNVVGIVAGYTYGNVTFDNIIVEDCFLTGFGKVGAIIGMAGDPGGVTTVTNCIVRDTTIKGTYNVATFIGLAQNTVAMTNCTYSDVAYVYGDDESSYTVIGENTITDNGIDISGATYWGYTSYNCYYTAWANYYNDYIYDVVNSIGMDGHAHNTLD